MFPQKYKNILVIAPHTDDGELGCGATINKLIRKKCNIRYLCLSICEQSVPHGLSEETLKLEMLSALKVYDIPGKNIVSFKFPVRNFHQHRQDILQIFVEENLNFAPDLIFCPTLNDTHQDHTVVAQECIRAFKRKSILMYEMPWNNFSFDTQVFIEVDQLDLEKKCEALSKYKSQEKRDYFKIDFQKSLLRVRGVQAGLKYAECFETPRIYL